jgi:hypothetical protein
MRLVTGVIAVGGVCGALTAPAASALTLGTTSFPDGSSLKQCDAGTAYMQVTDDGATPYGIPTGGGAITSWSVATAGSTPGAAVALLVLKPNGDSYSIDSYDQQQLPPSFPPNGVVAFQAHAALAAAAGDRLALFAPAAGIACMASDVGRAGDTVGAGKPPGIAAGASFGLMATPQTSFLLNVSAELTQTQDAAVRATTAPLSISAGGAAALMFTVTSSDPVSVGPIAFTDTVPNGLRVLAVAGAGSCSLAGQKVTCSLPNVTTTSAAPVSIVVSAARAGRYANSATVATSLNDPSSANNTSGATLTVRSAAATAQCKTIPLKGTSLALAKRVLAALSCKVGKVSRRASKKVHKGLVLSTKPGAGRTFKKGTAVKLIVSSGPPRKAFAKKKAKR